MMNKVWRSSTYSTRTKLKLYHSCVLTTLLYGSECWRLTEKDLSKLSTFHTKSLRRILRIFWPNVISNKDLFERCGTESMATILMRRRWRWIGHVTRQEASIAKTAMHWTPEGKRKRGRPKITWRRTVEKEIKEMGKTWEGIKFMAKALYQAVIKYLNVRVGDDFNKVKAILLAPTGKAAYNIQGQNNTQHI